MDFHLSNKVACLVTIVVFEVIRGDNNIFKIWRQEKDKWGEN